MGYRHYYKLCTMAPVDSKTARVIQRVGHKAKASSACLDSFFFKFTLGWDILLCEYFFSRLPLYF